MRVLNIPCFLQSPAIYDSYTQPYFICSDFVRSHFHIYSRDITISISNTNPKKKGWKKFKISKQLLSYRDMFGKPIHGIFIHRAVIPFVPKMHELDRSQVKFLRNIQITIKNPYLWIKVDKNTP